MFQAIPKLNICCIVYRTPYVILTLSLLVFLQVSGDILYIKTYILAHDRTMSQLSAMDQSL